MPLFDYKCLNSECIEYEHIYEKLVSGRSDYMECSNCQKPLELILGYRTYFQLKGSWPGKDIKRGDNE